MNEGLILIGLGVLLFGSASIITALKYTRLDHERILFQGAREKYEKAVKTIEEFLNKYLKNPPFKKPDNRIQINQDEFNEAFKILDKEEEDDKEEEGI